jgi:hypothetical protein
MSGPSRMRHISREIDCERLQVQLSGRRDNSGRYLSPKPMLELFCIDIELERANLFATRMRLMGLGDGRSMLWRLHFYKVVFQFYLGVSYNG